MRIRYHQLSGDGFTKLLACFLGLILACYATTEFWLNSLNFNSSTKQEACAIGLCPEEFSPERIFELQQLTNGEDATSAIADLKRAVRFDPASAYAWADLGEAEKNTRDISAAHYCFNRALALGPANPAILFRTANFDFQSGDETGTLKNLSAILKNPDLISYYESAFLTYSRMGLPIEQVLEQGIPPNSAAAAAFLRFWVNSSKLPEAKAVWKWLLKHAPPDDQLAGEYISFLIRTKSEREAADTWKELTVRDMPGYRESNFVYNGGFEQAPKLSPLDWTLNSVTDVLVSRVQSVAHDGNWSLRLVFEGSENVEFHQAVQDVVLSRGHWQLKAYLKTEQITTDEGVALHLFDAEQPSRLDVHIDSLTGSNPWTHVVRDFQVGPDTKILRLELMRQASMKFDNKISGSAWLDSVEISPIR